MAKNSKDRVSCSSQNDAIKNIVNNSNNTTDQTSEVKSTEISSSATNHKQPSSAEQSELVTQDFAKDSTAPTPSSPLLSSSSSSPPPQSTSTSVSISTVVATPTTTPTTTNAISDDKSRMKHETKSISSKIVTPITTSSNITTNKSATATKDIIEESVKVNKDKKDKTLKDCDNEKTMNSLSHQMSPTHSSRALPPPPLPAKRTTSNNAATASNKTTSTAIDFELAPIGRTRTLPNYGQQASSFVTQHQHRNQQQTQQTQHHNYRHQKSCPQFSSKPKCPLEEEKTGKWLRFSNFSLALFALIIIASIVLSSFTTWTMIVNARREMDTAKTFGEIVAIQADISDLTLAVGWEMCKLFL